MLVNLTVASPFYLVTQILLTASVHPTGLNLLWMWLVPACYLAFSSVLGITVNLLFPNFKWENEVRVVKQSASMCRRTSFGMDLSDYRGGFTYGYGNII